MVYFEFALFGYILDSQQLFFKEFEEKNMQFGHIILLMICGE